MKIFINFSADAHIITFFFILYFVIKIAYIIHKYLSCLVFVIYKIQIRYLSKQTLSLLEKVELEIEKSIYSPERCIL
jgi:hypothetical protein